MSGCAMGPLCESYSGGPTSVDVTRFVLCEKCAAEYSGAVRALVLDYVDLSRAIARRSGHSEVKISRPKPESTPPVDMGIMALRTDIALALVSCEVVLRTRMRLPARDARHVREGRNVECAAALVARYVDELASVGTLPDWCDVAQTGVAALTLLRRLHERAQHTLGLAELTIALPGICPKCHLHSLARRDGADVVVCTSCRHAMRWQQYQKLVTLSVTRSSVVDE